MQAKRRAGMAPRYQLILLALCFLVMCIEIV